MQKILSMIFISFLQSLIIELFIKRLAEINKIKISIHTKSQVSL